MRSPALAAVLLILAASPALAQAGTDASKAGVGGAGSAGADGKPGLGGEQGGKQGEGQQAATSGSKMVKRGDGGGAAAPAPKGDAPAKP